MLDRTYDAEKIELKWQKYWEEEGIYKFELTTDKPIYSIDTPPPTVSGKMHMGHAFGNSQQDFIARYKRMKGFNVLQPLGTDDNGLPTQTLIQNLKKVRARDMGRKAFRKLCLETLESGLKQNYINDWKRLGVSCDYDINYSTIDKHCQRISQWSFIELYKMGRAYRTEAATMWCPKCETAISQVELVDKKKNAFFNDVVFEVDGKELVIATTRPELLPACVAVFYHPNDKRYKHLKGKKAKVPLFDFEVPIFEDERVDPEKGTGIVMCCTFGDQTDMEWQKEYGLPVKEAITRDGRMSALAKGYEGLSISEAQKKIVMDLHAKGLLKGQKQIVHEVNCHERCDTPIEFVHSKQWFIKYLDLKEEMLKWGEELNWYPPHMKNRYDNWVKGLKWDWCISRQIYFGIPFPVWYCEDCDEVILAKEEDLPVDPLEDEPPVSQCPKCKSKKIIPETDVINTWATSSLTPTIVKELFKNKDRAVYEYLLKNPMNLRPQGHDIISFWLFNTVVKSKLHFNMKPWHDCFINGWMLDPKGKKMSKSRGNIIEPQVMIKKYSADALRYMAASSKLGEDLNFPEKELVSGKKTIIKLWNAARFCYSHLEDYDKAAGDKLVFKDLEVIDKWLLIRFNKLVRLAGECFDEYNFSEPKKATDNFFWHVFCDYYLEIVKNRLYSSDKENKNKGKLSAQRTMYSVLLGILKLFAPIMPHITEELYQAYYSAKDKEGCKSIHISTWPSYDAKLNDEVAEQAGELAVSIIREVRKYKTAQKMSLKDELSRVVVEAPLDIKKIMGDDLKGLEQDVISTVRAKKLELKQGDEFRIKIE